MTDDLKIAIEMMYSTFAIYSSSPEMDACPCCVSTEEKEKLHSKPLRKLDYNDLSRYMFKALTTWGEINDFKYFLPRIVELLSNSESCNDLSIVLRKLGYGDWRTWTMSEQSIIERFFYTWWAHYIKTKSYFDKELLIEMSKLSGDIDKVLDLWKIDFKDQSFTMYVELVYDYYADLMDKRKEFEELEQEDVDKLLRWIQENASKLEEGFFYFEHVDNAFADKISQTLYIYERTF